MTNTEKPKEERKMMKVNTCRLKEEQRKYKMQSKEKQTIKDEEKRRQDNEAK